MPPTKALCAMSKPQRPRAHTPAILAAMLCATVVAAVFGCAVDAPAQLTPSQNGEGGGAPQDAAAPNGGEEMFHAFEQQLFEACGGCHDAGGISNTPFLAGPDRYRTVLSWPGVIVKPSSNSSFLTHAVVGGGHSGTNLDADVYKDSLFPAVKAWLEEEARGIVEEVEDAGPRIAPFAPIMGFNAVYLDGLGENFRGMAITFNASLLTENALSLTSIEVHPTSKLGVHMVHPLFVVYPVGAEPDPDPVDSFSNVDQRFEANTPAALGPGTMILTNWVPDARMTIAFETIEALGVTGEGGAGGGGGSTGGCADVPSFQANAKGPLGVCASNCHGGQVGQATAAVDMSDLGSDDASACAQVKNRVNVGDPASSQLFVTTNPNGNAAHPYKFNGNDQDFAAFRDQVSMWISVEN